MNYARYQHGLKNGYRSGLEEKISGELKALGISFEYEKVKFKFLQPQKPRTYTPDFVLPNGIIVETKGRFLSSDRQKHILIKEQHPEYDIRFVFSNPQQRINKSSKTTYAKWCEDHGFLFAKGSIPKEWLKGCK
jgi:hypothetical protein